MFWNSHQFCWVNFVASFWWKCTKFGNKTTEVGNVKRNFTFLKPVSINCYHMNIFSLSCLKITSNCSFLQFFSKWIAKELWNDFVKIFVATPNAIVKLCWVIFKEKIWSVSTRLSEHLIVIRHLKKLETASISIYKQNKSNI